MNEHRSATTSRELTGTRIKKALALLVSTSLLFTSTTAYAGQVVTYVHTDHLGNPVAETNSLGRVIDRQSYTPYGDDEQGEDADGPGFTGHRNDAASELVYMQARYYDPEIGRFLSVDPVTFAPDRIEYFNRYWYAGGNPIKNIDVDGRCFGPVLAACIVYGKPIADAVFVMGTAILGAVLIEDAVDHAMNNEQGEAEDPQVESPEISPSDVAGKTPGEIDQIAKDAGLESKGPDPSAGKGAYVDPKTGEQRVLVHPNDSRSGPHAHVNDPEGNRLDISGNKVEPETPEAHLPIRLDE